MCNLVKCCNKKKKVTNKSITKSLYREVVCDDCIVQLSIVAVKLTLALSDTTKIEKENGV